MLALVCPTDEAKIINRVLIPPASRTSLRPPSLQLASRVAPPTDRLTDARVSGIGRVASLAPGLLTHWRRRFRAQLPPACDEHADSRRGASIFRQFSRTFPARKWSAIKTREIPPVAASTASSSIDKSRPTWSTRYVTLGSRAAARSTPVSCRPAGRCSGLHVTPSARRR